MDGAPAGFHEASVRALCCSPATIHGKQRAGDECRFVGGEIADHGGDLRWPAEAAEGLAGAEFGAGLLFVVFVKLFEVTLDEGCLDGAGADGVDAQSFGIVDGELAGHGDDCALGGAVGEALLYADQAGYGGDVDYCRAVGAFIAFGSFCEEQRHKGASDEVDGADIDVEEAVEVFWLGGFDGADVADAGVVDEDVEAGDFGDSGGDGGGTGDVEVEEFGGGERGGEGFAGWNVDVGDVDEGPGADEFADSGFADAAGTAGDEGVAVVEAERSWAFSGVHDDLALQNRTRLSGLEWKLLHSPIFAGREGVELALHVGPVHLTNGASHENRSDEQVRHGGRGR